MTKGNLMKMAYGKGYTNIDSAIPKNVADELRAMGINPNMYVMNYNEESLGRLENVCEVLVNKVDSNQRKFDVDKLIEAGNRNIVFSFDETKGLTLNNRKTKESITLSPFEFMDLLKCLTTTVYGI